MSDCLPQEVLIEIFTRLPIKTLFQVRRVCKRWKTLISDPAFITAHINRSNHSHRLILRHFTEKGRYGREHYLVLNDDDQTVGVHDVKLQFPFKTRSNYNFRIVGSCNGVLCLSDDLGAYAYGIILWNPSIRKYVTLPRPRVSQRTHGAYTLVLGFGFDLKSNDYKVVRIAFVKKKNGCELIPPEVEVYRLSSGSWRSFSAGAPPYGIYGYTGSNAFVNGAVHWIGYDPCVSKRNSLLIVSFDIGDEVFREVSLPDGLAQGRWELTVTKFAELLSVLQYDQCKKDLFCSMWLMKEYGVVGSWTKQYTIDMWGGLNKMIGSRKNGELLVVTVRGKLVSYDLNTRRMNGLGLRGAVDSFYVDGYMESLVLLEGKSAVLGADTITCEGGEEDGEVLQWTGYALEHVEEHKVSYVDNSGWGV